MKTDLEILKNKYITLSNTYETQVQTALMSLAEAYSDTGFTDQIELYQDSKTRLFVIGFPNPPDFDRFCYFINYLVSPEGVDYQAEITGYWKLSSSDEVFAENLENNCMIFFDRQLGDYNIVNILLDTNEMYQYNFDGIYNKVENHSRIYDIPKIDIENLEEIITIIAPIANDESINENKSGCLNTISMLILLITIFSIAAKVIQFM
jgi:hypothetical protein